MANDTQSNDLSSSPLLGTSDLRASPGFSKWTLDPTDVVTMVDLLLKGAEFEPDPVTGNLVAKTHPGLERLNSYGRREVMYILQSLVHKGVVLSNLPEKDIAEHIQELHLKLSDTLLRNWRRIGVDNPRQLPRLIYIIVLNVWAAFKRAQGATTWNQLNKIHMVQERVETKDNSGSLLPTFFGGGR